MKYQKAKEVNGKLEIVSTKTIDQSSLSSECWIVQFEGLAACETCELKDTAECGGSAIRERGTNELGNDVPL